MPRVNAYRLRHLARVYAQEAAASKPFTDLLAEAAVSPDVLEDMSAKIELTAEAQVVELACHALSDKTFAARAGLSTPGAKTLLAYLARASETVGQVLQFAQKYYALEDPDLQFHLVRSDRGPIVALESGVLAGHQARRHRELLVFGMFRRVQQIAGPDFGPLALYLDTPDAEHCAALAQLVACDVFCGHGMNGVGLPIGGLDYPIPTFDADLLDHLQAHGDARLEKASQDVPSLSQKVIKLVRRQLPGHLPSGDEIADTLCMTRRTLTRHLAAEGTSYKALAETARCDMAKRLLVGEGNIAQVAFLLDFADQAAFSVAFKRWTGTTPAQFKRMNA